MIKRKIKATYLAGRREDMGKYYYGETWTDENGEHFRVKFGKKIRTDRPWTFEEVKARQFKKAFEDVPLDWSSAIALSRSVEGAYKIFLESKRAA
jgi:hypothetical protein